MRKYAVISLLAIFIPLFFLCCGDGGGGADAVEAFTIEYNGNGAESGTAPAPHSGDINYPQVLSDNVGNLAKNGYLFDGWNSLSDGSGIDYAPGTPYSGPDIILYAKWAAIFDYELIAPASPTPAGGDAEQKAPPVSSDIRIVSLTERGKLLANIDIPAKINGYKVKEIGDNAFQNCSNIETVTVPETVTSIGAGAFAGCANLNNLTMKGTTPPVAGTGAFPDSHVRINVPPEAESAYQGTSYSAMIVFVNSFYVTYDKNGADGGAVPSGQVGTNGVSVNIYGNTGSLTRAGCTFNGWNTKPDGSGNRFAPSATYSGPDDIVLYAQWYHPTYTVTFDSQDATTEASPASIEVNAPANTMSRLPSNPVKTGYYFAGWYTGTNGTENKFEVGSPVLSSMTVYAYWTSNTDTAYKVEHYQQDVTGSGYTLKDTDDLTGTTGGTTNAEAKTYTGFKAPTFDQKTIAADGKTVVKINYDRNTYTVSFNVNGHGTAPADRTGVRYEATIDAPTDLTETGYTFGGWYKEIDCSTAWDFATDAVNANTTLYAKWTIKTYAVSFAANESEWGTVEPGSTITVEYGTGIKENADGSVTVGGTTVAPTPAAGTDRYEYGFGGWTLADGSPLPAAVTGDTALLASFTRGVRAYAVSFAANNASWGTVEKSAGCPNEFPFGTTISVSKDIITLTTPNDVTYTVSPKAKAGYEFSKWDPVPRGTVDTAKSFVASFVDIQDAKDAAIAELSAEAAVIAVKIDGLKFMSDMDKADYKGRAISALDAAKEQIDNASTIAGVKKAREDGEGALDVIENATEAAEDLAESKCKQDAKDELSESAEFIIQDIDAFVWLGYTVKENGSGAVIAYRDEAVIGEQKAVVSTALDAAVTAIEAAESSEAVDIAVTNGKAAMDSIEAAAEEAEAQAKSDCKDNAKKMIDSYANDAIDKIQQMSWLGGEKMRSLIETIHDQVDRGKQQIDNVASPAKAADEVGQKRSSFNQIVANSEDAEISITFKAGEGGSVSNSEIKLRRKSGEISEDITATPSPYYLFKNWTDESGKVVSESEAFRPQKEDGAFWAHTYTANFERETASFKVTVKDAAEYAIEKEATVTFTTGDATYEATGGAGAVYTFSNVPKGLEGTIKVVADGFEPKEEAYDTKGTCPDLVIHVFYIDPYGL